MRAGGSCRAWRRRPPDRADHHDLLGRDQHGTVEPTLVRLGGQRRGRGEGRVDPAEVEPAPRPHRDGRGAPAHRVGSHRAWRGRRSDASRVTHVEVTERSQRRRCVAQQPLGGERGRSARARGPRRATRRSVSMPGGRTAAAGGATTTSSGSSSRPSSPRPRSSASPGTRCRTQRGPGCSGWSCGRPTGRAIVPRIDRPGEPGPQAHPDPQSATGAVGVGVDVTHGPGHLVPPDVQGAVVAGEADSAVGGHQFERRQARTPPEHTAAAPCDRSAEAHRGPSADRRRRTRLSAA